MEEHIRYYPEIETHLIRSRYVAQEFKIQIMRPVRKRGETTRFPVLYATDGNFLFDMFKAICHINQSVEREGSRFILVGIGYPGDCPYAGALLRGRDYMFPGYPELKVTPLPIEGVLMAEQGTKNFGAAEDFQQFIAGELIPFIDRRYETIPGDRAYFGHSAGGGFGLYTLFTRSNLFNRYIISSPGLIFHGESSAGVRYDDHDFVLQDARRFIAAGKAMDGVKLYMSVGAEEEYEPLYKSFRLTSSFYRMVALMREAAIPGLDLTTEVFPGETHATVVPMAFTHGVQSVLGTTNRGTR